MLFKWGRFIGAAGRELDWKIECDALDAEDWACIARVGVGIVGPFRDVYGVPSGGLPLADMLRQFRESTAGAVLIVDDVWTTGHSLLTYASNISEPWVGFVAFARGHLPANVRCFAQMPPTDAWPASQSKLSKEEREALGL